MEHTVFIWLRQLLKTSNLPSKTKIFNIYHFAPFVKLHGCRFLYFFSLCDVRNKVVFLILEYFSLRGVKQKKTQEKNEILAFKPLLQEIQLKPWLLERVSEALTSKLWNKKIYMLLKLTEMEHNWIMFTPMILSKIFDRSI